MPPPAAKTPAETDPPAEPKAEPAPDEGKVIEDKPTAQPKIPESDHKNVKSKDFFVPLATKQGASASSSRDQLAVERRTRGTAGAVEH